MRDIHVGIILDGNRRWAKQRGWKPWDGHDHGAKKLNHLLDWILELELKELSLYCFSIQNFGRSKLEQKFMFDIARKEFKALIKNEKIYENKIKVTFAGRIHLFPEDLQEILQELVEKTKNHDQFKVNFGMAYGGREEIVDTVNKMVKEGKEITEKTLQENMWVTKNLDIVIRTGGDNRLSNFFPWQCTYAELFFLNKFWPEFEKEDLVKVINEFETKRQRRFGH